MRVLTWNLWWQFGDWRAREEAIVAVLAEQEPDVVLLQEVWAVEHGEHQAERLAERLGLHWVAADQPFYRRDTAAYGGEAKAFVNAVLSRWPVLDTETLPLVRADGQPGHRHVLFAGLDAPAGRRLVASTHFEWPYDQSSLRCLQAEALLAAVAARRGDTGSGYPVVVGGDLNAPPDSDELRLLTGRRGSATSGLVFQDAWEVAGDGGPGHTWDSSNPYLAEATWPRRRLDYLLVSWPRPRPAGNPTRCRLAGTAPVDGVVGSDHYAVVADLAEPAGRDTTYPND